MSKQQTAVQWLENQIISELDKSQDTKLGLYFIRFMELVNQAKAMEKQQIETAYIAGREYGCKHDDPETGEQYYTENFKTESE